MFQATYEKVTRTSLAVGEIKTKTIEASPQNKTLFTQALNLNIKKFKT